jgi:hypothetical protein
MSRIYLLVEGQTEEAFVGELLTPHYARLGLYLTPIIVSTSPGHKGGVVSYAKVKPQISRLCRQDSRAKVSTLFDLYALPIDFPGKADAGYPANGSGVQKADYLEARLKQDINEGNFLKNSNSPGSARRTGRSWSRASCWKTRREVSTTRSTVSPAPTFSTTG